MMKTPVRRIALGATFLALIGLAYAQGPTHFSHLTYTPPAGWTSTQSGGWTLLAAPNLPAGQAASIGISPGGETARTLADEFDLLVKASQANYTILKTEPVVSKNDDRGIPTLTQTVAFQDAAGKQYVRRYVAKKIGSRFEAIEFTSTLEAAKTTFPAFQTLYTGLVYDGAPAPEATKPTPGEPKARGAGGLVPGAPAQPVGAPQGAGVKLSTHDLDIGAVSMAVGRDGTIHVAFVERLQGIENAVYYRSSSDGGRSWSAAKNMSEVMPGLQVGYVKVAVDASNRVYVVWRAAEEINVPADMGNHSQNASSNIVYRVRTGGAWSGSALNVNPPCDHNSQDRGAASFFVGSDPAGRVHVAYVQNPDILHPEYMYERRMHQAGIGLGDVVQVDLSGTSHSAPREIFMAKVTDDGTWKGCDGLDVIEGYFDDSGAAHFSAYAWNRNEASGANRIVVVEDGTMKPGITLPGQGFTMWSPPATLLLDAQGRKHIIALFAAGERHGIRDYLLGSDAEPRVIRSAAVTGTIQNFQACQGPNGQMIALMAMNDTGKRGVGELYIATSSGGAWTKPVAVTHNTGASKSTYGARRAFAASTTTTWYPGIATAAVDRQGHLVLLHERDEYSIFGSSAFGVTTSAGDTSTPRLYFLRF